MANKFQSSAFTQDLQDPRIAIDPAKYLSQAAPVQPTTGGSQLGPTMGNAQLGPLNRGSVLPQASQMAGLGTTGQVAAQSTTPSTQDQGFFSSIGDMFNDTFRTQDFNSLGSMGQKGLNQYGATPEQFNNMNFEGQQALLGHTTEGFSPSEQLAFAKTDNLNALADQRNSFNWSGAANLGLSAFNAYNQYNYQNEALKMARNEAAVRDRELARKDKTRSNWSGVL